MATSLDYYFKRDLNLNKPDQRNDKATDRKRLGDDVEVHPGYFVKKKLYDKMFDYQKKGLKWLFSIHEQTKGCVLADDMGLGKTLQTIALLASLFRYNRIKHVLIIAPTTLLINWKKEFKRWADFEMYINTIDGGVVANKRLQMIDSVQSTGGILMMTYDLARSLQEDLSSLRGKDFTWDYVILDEAHKIKNQSKTTKEMNKLPSRLRLAITGTPVQNNLSELWSIFNFAMQGSLLGTYATFKRTYEKPIESGRKKDATTREKVLGNKIAKSLRKIYEPYLLRRTKEDIFGVNSLSNEISINGQPNQLAKQSLPPKYDFCIWTRMNECQIRLYEDFLNSDEVKEILANPTTCKSPLVQLNVLKKICDHPRLLTKNTFEKLIYNEDVDLDKLSTVHGVPVDRLLKESSKLRVLNELLKLLIAENPKVKILLFSPSTKMLDIIEKVLDMNKIRFSRLDGQVKSNDQREQIVQRFRKDPSIPLMLLTVQVGGVGLTLTEATRVIIFSLSWNPGNDSQAVDRAYRIGQKNPNVIVYRFMTCTTVEEKIYSRQIYKDSLNKQTIGKENDPARYFTSTDLYQLFETGDFSKSKVCDEFNELHGTLEDKLILEAQVSNQLGLNDEQQLVLNHKEKIKNQIKEIYGISEHSLVFSKTFEKLNTSGIDFAYLNNEVKTAKELLLKESLVANSSHDPDLNRDVLSAKQRLITQQFGTEFLPLGRQFNQYREGTNKFEFKRPQPKSPVKIVNLDDDDDDEIQFIDTANNTILPSLNNTRKSTNSSSSSLNNFSKTVSTKQSSSSSLRSLTGSNASNLESHLKHTSSTIQSAISKLNQVSSNSQQNSIVSNKSLKSQLSNEKSTAPIGQPPTGHDKSSSSIQSHHVPDVPDIPDTFWNSERSDSSSSLNSQLSNDKSMASIGQPSTTNHVPDIPDTFWDSESSNPSSSLSSTTNYDPLNSNLNGNIDSISKEASSRTTKSQRSPMKDPELIDLSFNMNNMSVMSVDEQQEPDKSEGEMSYILSSFDESIRLDGSAKKKKNQTNDSIIVLD